MVTSIKARFIADVIRLEVRESAGIVEGEEFHCDWDRVANTVIRTLGSISDQDREVGFCGDYRHPWGCQE